MTALKTALDGARKSFAATAPPGVEEARAKLRPLAIVLNDIAETRSLGQRWQKAAVEVRADEDLRALIQAGQRLADSEAEDVEARTWRPRCLAKGESVMNGVTVRVVGTKIVVEVDILKAIAEGVGGSRPISTVKPGPKPKTSTPSAS